MMERCIENAESHCKSYPRCYGCNAFRNPTNADRIRAMSDEELAKTVYAVNLMEEKIPFCQNLPECDSLLETEEGIPEDKCIGCLLKWLQQPAQEG